MGWNQKPHCFSCKGLSTEDAPSRQEHEEWAWVSLCLFAVSWLHKWAANKVVLSPLLSASSLPIGLWSPLLCVLCPFCSKSPVIFSWTQPGALDSLTLNPWNDHCWWLTFIYSLKFPIWINAKLPFFFSEGLIAVKVVKIHRVSSRWNSFQCNWET